MTVPEQSLPQPKEPARNVPCELEPDAGSHGTDDGRPSDSGTAQGTLPPVLRLMLASVQTSAWPVCAGQDFSAEAVLKNVSGTQAVTNILVGLTPAGETLAPQPGQALSFHFDRIPAEGQPYCTQTGTRSRERRGSQ